MFGGLQSGDRRELEVAGFFVGMFGRFVMLLFLINFILFGSKYSILIYFLENRFLNNSITGKYDMNMFSI